jgi:hypothetical protein
MSEAANDNDQAIEFDTEIRQYSAYQLRLGLRLLAWKERVEAIGKETWFDWTDRHMDRADEARKLVASVEKIILEIGRAEIEEVYGTAADSPLWSLRPPRE